ncbi:MAG: hypothetical protein ABSH25_14030 [Syntrophorhabdales bacterium]
MAKPEDIAYVVSPLDEVGRFGSLMGGGLSSAASMVGFFLKGKG